MYTKYFVVKIDMIARTYRCSFTASIFYSRHTPGDLKSHKVSPPDQKQNSLLMSIIFSPLTPKYANPSMADMLVTCSDSAAVLESDVPAAAADSADFAEPVVPTVDYPLFPHSPLPTTACSSSPLATGHSE